MTRKLLSSRRKLTVKLFLAGAAVAAISLVPGNSAFVFGYGTAPTFPGSTTEPPTCTKETPGQVILYEPNHPLLPRALSNSDVRLNWLKAEKANKYTIAFGLTSGNYIYGLPDIGDTDHFTVNNLTPGQKYYFVVRGVNECKPGQWSREWSFTSGNRIGFATNLNTNSEGITAPRNITTYYNNTLPTPTPAYQPPVQNVQGTNENGVQQPASGQAGIQTPPPVQAEVGFFEGLWNSFLKLLGL